MGNTRPLFKNAKDAIDTAINVAYPNKDFELCRQAMNAYFNLASRSLINTYTPDSLEESIFLHDLLVVSKLNKAPVGSLANIFYSRVYNYMRLHATPEISTFFEETANKLISKIGLKPTGYTDDGEPCYNLSDLAELLNIEEKNVRNRISNEYLIPEKKINKLH